MRPELLVQPEGLDTETSTPQNAAQGSESSDPLLGLFLSKAILTPKAFMGELQRQRGPGAASAAAAK
jgi:hypothetical protein